MLFETLQTKLKKIAECLRPGAFKTGREIRLSAVYASDRGKVREENQDHVLVDVERGLFCVADGMGGGDGGALASRIICDELRKAASGFLRFGTRKAKIESALSAANESVRSYAAKQGFDHMGSTAAILSIERGGVGMICHIGDSRVYRLRSDGLTLLTDDHTIGGELNRTVKNDSSASVADRSHPLAHVLTRSVGGKDEVEPDWREVEVAAGDRYLICSDGLHDVVPDVKIRELISGGDLAGVRDGLSAEIERCGAPDNYSFIVIDVEAAK